jgi:hypothetical protein
MNFGTLGRLSWDPVAEGVVAVWEGLEHRRALRAGYGLTWPRWDSAWGIRWPTLEFVRIVLTGLRGAAEFAYRADRAVVHLVGLGFRAGCRGSELWAGWPDGVRCTLGQP